MILLCPHRDGDVDHCEYFEEKSKHWTDKDKIDFNRDIKGVDNPIVVDIVDYEVNHSLSNQIHICESV